MKAIAILVLASLPDSPGFTSGIPAGTAFREATTNGKSRPQGRQVVSDAQGTRCILLRSSHDADDYQRRHSARGDVLQGRERCGAAEGLGVRRRLVS